VAFTGEGKLVRKATGFERQEAEAALSRIGFADCANRASGRHWSVSVTHRFLLRGFFMGSTDSLTSTGAIKRDLYLVSLPFLFLFLFLELAFIRWLPAEVPFLTFFTNTTLLACFLGLPVGCLAARHKRNYRALQGVAVGVLVFSPIFCAGIIFARLFPRAEKPNPALAYNAAGAILGGGPGGLFPAGGLAVAAGAGGGDLRGGVGCGRGDGATRGGLSAAATAPGRERRWPDPRGHRRS
jgi:hypothetical protein